MLTNWDADDAAAAAAPSPVVADTFDDWLELLQRKKAGAVDDGGAMAPAEAAASAGARPEAAA